jgi:hypothetical protein
MIVFSKVAVPPILRIPPPLPAELPLSVQFVRVAGPAV